MSDSVLPRPAPAGTGQSAGPPNERHRDSPRIRERRRSGRAAAPGRTGSRRRDRSRRSVASGLVVALVCSFLVLATAVTRSASAQEPPPGGVVPSAAKVGWTQGEFSVSDDGAAQYGLPLWMPQGRGKVAPELALSYDSRGGNGPLGVGWSLDGLSSITWCSRTYAQDGYTDGRHFDGASPLCLGGNRLMPVSAAQLPQREYRTEREMFARIVAYGMEDNVPNYFKVWAKDGKILTFGQTTDARLQAYPLRVGSSGVLERASTSRVTTQWGVDRIEDRNGNAATVEYDRFEGTQANLWYVEMRPRTIRYAPNRMVEFFYENRPDPIDGFSGGVHTRHASRISRIAMFGGPQGGASELLREYRLAYQANSITGRSLLDSVTECDHDGACKVPLRFDWSLGSYGFKSIDTTVTDAGSLNSGSKIVVGDIDGDGRDDLLYPDALNNWKVRRSTGSGFDVAVAAGIPKIGDDERAQIRSIDFDRDGRMDVMVEVPDSSPGETGWQLYRSNGRTFVPYSTLGHNSADDEPDPVYFADLDGNGMPDFVTAPKEPGDDGIAPWSYRLNTGSDAAGRFQAKVQSPIEVPHVASKIAVTDTDGDGRAELQGQTYGQLGPAGLRTFGLNAAGGAEATVTNFGDDGSNDGDFNGDGLEDGLRTYGGLQAGLNSGNGYGPPTVSPGGFVPPMTSCNPCPGPNHAGWDRGVRIVDFNNDGRDDVLIFHGQAPSGPNDPTRGAQLYVWRDNGFVRAPLSQDAGNWTRYGFSATQPLDIDGDGVLDIVHVAEGGRLRILKRTGSLPDQLVGIGDASYGPRVEVDYKMLARGPHTPVSPGACGSYPQVCPTKGGSVVAQHRIATFVGAGSDGWDRYNHNYKAARTDVQGRAWLGFAEHTVTRFQTGTGVVSVTVTEFDNVTRDLGVTAVYPFANVPKRTTYTVKDSPQGREYKRTVTNENHVRRTTGGGYTVEQRGVTESEQERPVGATTWQTLRIRTTQREYDRFGNEELVVAGGFVNRKTTTSTTYENNEDSWLIGLPTRQVTEGCTTTPSVCMPRVSTFDHDDKGNLTLTVVEPNKPTLKLSTVIAYAEFGTVGSVTTSDNAGQARKDTFEYGNADKLHPTATINAVGHKTLISTHSGLGVPISTTDPNGVTTTMRYDRFGRVREINRSDGSFEHATHANFFGSQLTTTTDAGGGRSTVVLDQLGRERQRQVKAFDGRTATTHTSYDFLGRVLKVSRPALPGETVQYTTSQYDNRDRLVRQTAPDGAVVRHEYTGLQTHSYDAKGIHSYVVESLDGDVESRYEDDPASTGWLRTRFEYGPFGEPTKTVAPDGTTQTMSYDIRGRRERLGDPTTGATVSTYNAFGDVRTETDGSDKTSTYVYDALGRVKTVTSPDGLATNTWDTAPYGAGLLANARSADGVGINYRYDDQARPATTTWNIQGKQYEIGHGYDSIGRAASITYPAVPGAGARLTVGYVYNQHGYLSQARDAAAGGAAYWTAEQRNGAGQLERERYGNGVVTTRSHASTTGLLQNIRATGPGAVGTLGDILYGYDLNRNVTGRTDTVNNRWEVYDHDTLNRLDRWHTLSTGPGQVPIQATYAYDKVGNLKNETFQTQGEPKQVTTYGYGENGAPPHAQTSRNSTAYTYDGAGRQLSGPNRTVQYNTAGLPKVLNWGIGQGEGRRTDFRYDADGARVVKEDRDQTIVSVPGLFEQRTSHPGGDPAPDFVGVRSINHIVVDGRAVAQVSRFQDTPGGPVTLAETTYLHADQQGSTTLVTGATGHAKEELFYDPFGRRTDAAYQPLGDNRRGGPRLGYTGHEHDDEYGLINMKGRVYDPEARRFLTPDPIISDPLSSQSHNRYAYVWNNPTTYTDPTGFWRTDGFFSGTLDGVGKLSYAPEDTLTSDEIAMLDEAQAAVRSSGASDDYDWREGSEVITVEGKRIPNTSGFDAITAALSGWLLPEGTTVTGSSASGERVVKLSSGTEENVTKAEGTVDLLKVVPDSKGRAKKSGPVFGVEVGVTSVETEVGVEIGPASAALKATGPAVKVGASVSRAGAKVEAGATLGKAGVCVKACGPALVVDLCVSVCGGLAIGVEASAQVGPGGVAGTVTGPGFYGSAVLAAEGWRNPFKGVLQPLPSANILRARMGR